MRLALISPDGTPKNTKVVGLLDSDGAILDIEGVVGFTLDRAEGSGVLLLNITVRVEDEVSQACETRGEPPEPAAA